MSFSRISCIFWDFISVSGWLCEKCYIMPFGQFSLWYLSIFYMCIASCSFCVFRMRSTFSITNHWGRILDIISAYATVRSPRPLFSSRFPADEKSWHGGPPIIISGAYGRISSTEVSISIRSARMADWRKLFLYTASASVQLSNAATISIPALAKPRLKPPQPQNKSTTLIL